MLRGEQWWTNSFSRGTVSPFWQRLILFPIYMLYTGYLCLRGIPINVNLKHRSSEQKEKVK